MHYTQYQTAGDSACLMGLCVSRSAITHAEFGWPCLSCPALDQADPNAELMLELPDSFGRLLMHGLAQFHGLQSSTCIKEGQKQVLLQCRQHSTTGTPPEPPAQAIQAQQASLPDQQLQQPPALQAPGSSNGEAAEGSSSGGAAEWLLHASDITCTDIIMALQELGGGSLNHQTLGHYMRTVHGSTTSGGDVCEQQC